MLNSSLAAYGNGSITKRSTHVCYQRGKVNAVRSVLVSLELLNYARTVHCKTSWLSVHGIGLNQEVQLSQEHKSSRGGMSLISFRCSLISMFERALERRSICSGRNVAVSPGSNLVGGFRKIRPNTVCSRSRGIYVG